MVTKRTRRSNGEGAIGQRKDGRWEARYTLPNGKRACSYGKTRGEALSKRDEALRKAQKGINRRAERQPLKDYLDLWYTEVATPRCKAKTLRSYRQLIDVHIVPGLGDIELRDLSVEKVQRFINERHKSGLSPRTVNHIRAVLRNALAEAVRWGFIERNVAALANPPRLASIPAAYLTAEQALKLIEHTREQRHGPLFALALYLGMRQAELLGLRWVDVDLDAGVLHVRQTVQRINGAWLVQEPKSLKSRRTLPLTTMAVAALRVQEELCAEMRTLAGARWQEYGLVFPSSIGTPQIGSLTTRKLQEALAAAELPRVTFHALRHTCATLLLSQGVPARVIQDVLGHSTVSLTLGTYSHVMPAMLQDAADAMTRALGKP